jgi:aldehyde dehydrogenase (NAD+)
MADKSKVVGNPKALSMEIGPLVDAAQFDRVAGFIEKGEKNAGNLVVGGKRLTRDLSTLLD